MNRQEQELLVKSIEIAALVGELKGELATVKKENEYLRGLLGSKVGERNSGIMGIPGVKPFE